jgi:hypothetical protein
MAEGVHPIPELSYFVSTLLEILDVERVDNNRYALILFQPFLRFWVLGRRSWGQSPTC